MKAKSLHQRILFITGILLILAGVSVLSFFAVRKVIRIVQLQKLLEENVVVEIPALDIKAPVLEGTDQAVLRKGAGHFPGTGDVGSGNYCIAGHSSTIYKEFFNNLKNITPGTEIYLYDKQKKRYTYLYSESCIVDPEEVWVLNETPDDRITIITCTDTGEQRLVVVGKRKDDTS